MAHAWDQHVVPRDAVADDIGPYRRQFATAWAIQPATLGEFDQAFRSLDERFGKLLSADGLNWRI
jgi:hypothetical protein